jgi:hypothetical protein
MKIECISCGKTYDIPDERLKSTTKRAFNCPAWGGLVTIELPESARAGGDSGGATIAVSEELKHEIIIAIKALEPMPGVVKKAREVMASPNATFKKVGAVIETDQAISAKFLKIANSAYYGLSGRVSSIHQAMVALGNDTIEQVINAAGASKLFSKTIKGYELPADVQWKLPEIQAAGIKYHHDPLKSGGNDLAYFLNLSNCLALKCGFGAERTTEEEVVVPEEFLAFFGFQEPDLSTLADEITAYVADVSSSVL